MQGQGLFQGQEYVGVDLASSRPGFELSQDGGNEFRNGRMYVHGTLQRRVGCLSVHDVENAVDDLVAADTEDGGSENLPCVGIDDDFDEALSLSLLDDATLVIGRIPTRMRLPKCRASSSVIPARPSGGSR